MHSWTVGATDQEPNQEAEIYFLFGFCDVQSLKSEWIDRAALPTNTASVFCEAITYRTEVECTVLKRMLQSVCGFYR